MANKPEKEAVEALVPTLCAMTIRRLKNGEIIAFVDGKMLMGVYQLSVSNDTRNGPGVVLSFDSRFVEFDTEKDELPKEAIN